MTQQKNNFLFYNNDRVYAIKDFIDNVKDYHDFIDNKGYIQKESGDIYICSLTDTPKHNDIPLMFVYPEENKIEFREPRKPGVKEIFNAKNITDLSQEKIINNTNKNEKLYNEEMLADMNAASTVYIPVINETDDNLKKIIKQTILSKGIDITVLKHKFVNSYEFTNLKTALEKSTKMSITNFNLWCEALEVNYTITITDNGKDERSPLSNDIVYTSSDNKLKF